jgi:hypothetical protein
MIHLSTYNISYGLKKLKAEHHLELRACKWHATYRWKAFNKGYNFFFLIHLNQRSTQEITSLQSFEILNLN